MAWPHYKERNINVALFAEHKHVQDVKEETEDFVICEPSRGDGGGSPEATGAGKRSSAEIDTDTDQSTSSKKARISSEVI